MSLLNCLFWQLKFAFLGGLLTCLFEEVFTPFETVLMSPWSSVLHTAHPTPQRLSFLGLSSFFLLPLNLLPWAASFLK